MSPAVRVWVREDVRFEVIVIAKCIQNISYSSINNDSIENWLLLSKPMLLFLTNSANSQSTRTTPFFRGWRCAQCCDDSSRNSGLPYSHIISNVLTSVKNREFEGKTSEWCFELRIRDSVRILAGDEFEKSQVISESCEWICLFRVYWPVVFLNPCSLFTWIELFDLQEGLWWYLIITIKQSFKSIMFK